ncbi:hypothetical protein C8R48DRAFT_550248, partial [Suillus tomentosus]
LCQSQPLLLLSLVIHPTKKCMKLYYGWCKDIYSPKSLYHGSFDGTYFDTFFPHLFKFFVYPSLLPPKAGPVD